MQTYDLVKAALKEKNPALYKELTASKKLNEFVRERADEIRSELPWVVVPADNDRIGGWNLIQQMLRFNSLKIFSDKSSCPAALGCRGSPFNCGSEMTSAIASSTSGTCCSSATLR